MTVTGVAVERDLARVRRGDPEERQPDVGAAGADETGEAEHFAGAQLEGDVLKDALAAEVAGPPAGPRPVRAARGGRAPTTSRPTMPRMAAAGVSSARGVVEIQRPSRRIVTRSAISNTSSMRWEMKRIATPCCAQVVHDAEELADLVRREGRGRLVHDQHAHVERDGLGDLDGLLLGEGQSAGRFADVEADVEPGQHLARLALHPPPVDDFAAVAVADEDVLRDRQVGEDHRFLVDGGDAEALRILGGGDADRLRRRRGSRRCPAAGCRS